MVNGVNANRLCAGCLYEFNVDLTTEALVHGRSQPCQDINVVVLRVWDLTDAISIEGLQQLVGILKVCRHEGVFGKEVMIDLMNNQLRVIEYLKLSSSHVFG